MTPSWLVHRAAGTFPNRSTQRDDVRMGLRTMNYRKRITVAFVVAGDGVVILVYSCGQDYEAALREDGGEEENRK